jgi:hypothetical protein
MLAAATKAKISMPEVSPYQGAWGFPPNGNRLAHLFLKRVDNCRVATLYSKKGIYNDTFHPSHEGPGRHQPGHDTETASTPQHVRL